MCTVQKLSSCEVLLAKVKESFAVLNIAGHVKKMNDLM